MAPSREARLSALFAAALMAAAVVTAAGVSAGCASSGPVRAWGDNLYGQLGDGTYVQRTSPVAVNTTAGGAAPRLNVCPARSTVPLCDALECTSCLAGRTCPPQRPKAS